MYEAVAMAVTMHVKSDETLHGLIENHRMSNKACQTHKHTGIKLLLN